MGDSRSLVVMRHGKAEEVAPTDAARALTARGVADSAEAGAWLTGRGVVPDRALVSPAVRTGESWAAVAEGAGWVVVPTVEESLYEAGTDTALDLLRGTADDVRTLMVVGHNPTMASLAQLLDDGEGDDEVTTQMVLGFPTSAVAVFGYAGPWADLDVAAARVLGFHVGRG